MGSNMIDGTEVKTAEWTKVETQSAKDDITDDGYSTITPSPMSALGGQGTFVADFGGEPMAKGLTPTNAASAATYSINDEGKRSKKLLTPKHAKARQEKRAKFGYSSSSSSSGEDDYGGKGRKT